VQGWRRVSSRTQARGAARDEATSRLPTRGEEHDNFSNWRRADEPFDIAWSEKAGDPAFFWRRFLISRGEIGEARHPS